jgi:hypothetical protein
MQIVVDSLLSGAEQPSDAALCGIVGDGQRDGQRSQFRST